MPEQGELVNHLCLQPFEVLQRHIQKVAAATGRVKHPHAAQRVVKDFDLLARLGQFGQCRLALQFSRFMCQHQRGGLGVGPFSTQGLDHGGQHQPLDIGPRRVVRTQRVALGGVQGTLQQGAKNGRLDLAPIGLRGLDQQVYLLLFQEQTVPVRQGLFEQFAIEMQHALGQCRAKTTPVHIGPQALQHQAQRGRVGAVGLEQADEGLFGQQADIFGKHAKQAAGQERRYFFRSYLCFLNML
ncbi:hypothetical protein GALL_456460 [mine drainage metagenome]|uniref:Uncharacterized protein n=1 Tax=mine drainage metagenome TaxID=410659 RepID=A0A1J5PYR5_9ZZZZ